MSSRWLREFPYSTYSTDQSFYPKLYALFLRYVMDYTLQTESVAGGKSFVSTDKSGTGGSFAGGNYVFTISSGLFDSSDVGKYLIVRDNTNPVNAGIYKINWYSDTNNITIDYKAGYGEFPVASTSLTWRICGSTYQVPSTASDYVRLQSRHTTGWAIELSLTTSLWMRVRVATAGEWVVKTIGNFTGLDQAQDTIGLRKQSGGLYVSYYAEGDYDGEWLHMWMQYRGDTSLDDTGGPIQLVSIERVTPIEAGVTDPELLVLYGPSLRVTNVNDGGGRWYSSDYAHGQAWIDNIQSEGNGFMFDYSSSLSSTAFTRWNNREVNWRRDGRLEAFHGTPFILDENNAYGYYRLLGYMKGHWTVPFMAMSYSKDLDYVAYRKIHRMVTMNMSGTRDKLLILDGIVVPWCNLTIRGI
jgi:hypothetical protein